MNSAGQSISVSLATCNGGPYILEQLESMAAQTRLPDEILIGDDRSTDNTLNVVEEFARRSGLTVRVQTNPQRLGSTGNFEQILSRCSGDIIVLSDQDDIWRPDKLQQIEAAFAGNPYAPYAFSNGSLINESGYTVTGSLWKNALFSKKEQDLYRAGRGAEVLLRHNVVTGAAMALRRRSIAPALPIAQGWIHDYWLAYVLETSGPGVMLEEPLISYRRHATQQVGLFEFSLSYASAAIRRHDARYCTMEANNFDALGDRLEQLAVPALLVDSVREKAAFYRRRSSMRTHPNSAPAQILRSWLAGDYNRFSPEFKFVLPDIPLDAGAALLSWVSARSKRVQRRDGF